MAVSHGQADPPRFVVILTSSDFNLTTMPGQKKMHWSHRILIEVVRGHLIYKLAYSAFYVVSEAYPVVKEFAADGCKPLKD